MISYKLETQKDGYYISANDELIFYSPKFTVAHRYLEVIQDIECFRQTNHENKPEDYDQGLRYFYARTLSEGTAVLCDNAVLFCTMVFEVYEDIVNMPKILDFMNENSFLPWEMYYYEIPF